MATVKQISSRNKPVSDGRDSFNILNSNQSGELVIGFCGAVGAGIENAKPHLIKKLLAFGYEVEEVKVSKLLRDEIPDDFSGKEKLINPSKYDRYYQLQELGNFLRKKYGNAVATELVIRQIAVIRKQKYNDEPKKKIAYIVDQLKHPDEAKLLRLIYQNNFYLAGVYADREHRRRNLEKEEIERYRVEELIERDRKDSNSHGQQLDKTFHLADYFLVNEGNSEELKIKLDRLVELIHGSIKFPPTNDERAMYAAYSASLNSICLSRQVGASISDESGNIIATGFNDAPKYGGGLYSSSDKHDNRCVFKNSLCSNDLEKNRIKSNILESLKSNDLIEFIQKGKLLEKNKKHQKTTSMR